MLEPVKDSLTERGSEKQLVPVTVEILHAEK